MKRRRFIQTIAATPALALPIKAEQAPQTRPQTEAPKLEIAPPDQAAETTQRFFNPQQFAALRRLSDLLTPSLKDSPGALEAGAPEFLDFLIGASPAETKQLYTAGLDALNAAARKKFGKPYADLEAAQAVELLAPLKQPWTFEGPSDPLARFLIQAKQDVRTATFNSREYVMASSTGGRRGDGMGQYWYPID